MDSAFVIVNTLLLLIAIVVSVYLVRAVMKIFRAKKQLEQKDSSQVGFVVDTFHDLVSKLKEKEQELEDLRQKAEDRATEIEDYNENILQSVPSGVISFDRDMKITKVNSAAEKILEIDERSAFDKHYKAILKEPIVALLEDNKNVERGEISYLTPSGKRIWLGLTLSPLKNTEGEAIGQILVFTDLTHLKAFESQIALRDKFSSLGEISAGIAHELRNPMGVIAGYTKLLTRKINPPLKPTVDAISKEIIVMDRIISDFLSFAKLTEPDISRFVLKKLIANCLTAVLGNRKDIVLHLNIKGTQIEKVKKS
jgi:two-component system sensor histidine kinase PilS (NtrC family)